MPNKTKVYDQAQEAASDLRRDMRTAFMLDGVLEESEKSLLAQADRVCSFSSNVAARFKAAQRIAGGGELDSRLWRDLRDAEMGNQKPAGDESASFGVEGEKLAA